MRSPVEVLSVGQCLVALKCMPCFRPVFKPKGDFSSTNPMTMIARDDNNNIVYQSVMNTPNDFPKIYGQTDYDGEITKPDNFDKVINRNWELKKPEFK